MSTMAKLSVPEYEHIVASGVFDGKNKRRIELMWGELREMGTTAKLSIEEFEQIVESGVFDGINPRRVELIWGELYEMTPIGAEHAMAVDWLTDWSVIEAHGDFWTRIQNPLRFLAVGSEPLPDVVWAKRRGYGPQLPTADDVFLIIEVSASSLEMDRGRKANLYAAVGIRDYWIVNLEERTIEVRRDPHEGVYRSVRIVGAGAVVESLFFPRVLLNVDSLFASLE